MPAYRSVYRRVTAQEYFCTCARKDVDHATDTCLRPERRNSKKLTPLYLQVSQMLKRIAYSRMPFGELEPRTTLRSKAKDLMACSALLLFHGIPSKSRNVKSLSRFF